MLCFLSLPSTLVQMIVLTFLSFLATAFGVFVWLTMAGVVYKSWCLNALEVSFILNLGIVAVAIPTMWPCLVEARLLLHTAQLAQHSSPLWGSSPTTFTCESNQNYSTCMQCGHQSQHKNEKCHDQCKTNGNPGNLQYQRVNINVTCTEINLHELRSPLDLLDTK